MADDDLRDLAWRAGFCGVIADENLCTGLKSILHAVWIKHAAHNSTEDSPGIGDPQVLAGWENALDRESAIIVRRILKHGFVRFPDVSQVRCAL